MHNEEKHQANAIHRGIHIQRITKEQNDTTGIHHHKRRTWRLQLRWQIRRAINGRAEP